MRKSLLYPKLAFVNLKKNKRLYVPYLLAAIGTVMMFCILMTLSDDPAWEGMSGGMNVVIILRMGCVIVAIFSAILLFYTSASLTKQRKKEFGLYNVLGMEKRHIGRVLSWETLYTAAMALAGGLVCGVIFSKLMQMLLLRLLGCEVQLGLRIDPPAIISTAVLFAVIFFLILMNTRRIIHVANPVELLRGSAEGEREPRSKWLLAVLGVLLLAGGYIMSICSRTSYMALLLFFLAVLLVILGTYLLFIAFSIVFLKGLRKNKKFYYKTRNFATVSGMLYRMKRNAAGLASICILSTMVLVTVSTTVCLYLGADKIIDRRYPYDLSATVYSDVTDGSDLARIEDYYAAKAQEHGLTVTNSARYFSLNAAFLRDGDSFTPGGDNVADATALSSAFVLWFTTAEGYGTLTGQTVSLAPGEALCYCDGPAVGDTLSVLGFTFELTHLDGFPVSSGYETMNLNTCYVVVDSLDTLLALEDAEVHAYSEMASAIEGFVGVDISGSEAAKYDCGEDAVYHMSEYFDGTDYGERFENLSVMTQSKQLDRQADYSSFFGAFFFLGMFLGLLFIMATVLIIYYKQVSEGYDDRDKFDIMQKVGMTPKEVRATIRRQVLIVFFLPLGTAAVHIAFAFPMMRRILSAFAMTDVALFAVCTLCTLLAFAVLYTAVYLVTARVYYHIVRGEDWKKKDAAA